MRAAWLLALASACALPDQKLGLLACADDPEPQSAPPDVVISGEIVDPFTNTPVSGLSLVSVPAGYSATSDAMGQFDGTLPTNGAPVMDYLKITGAGVVDAYYYPPASISTDQQLGLQAYMPAELAMIGSAAGMAIGSDTQQVVVSVEDCNGSAVAGASISTSSGKVVFFMGDQPDPQATATDGVTGAAIIVGITGSTTTIAASTPEHNFRMHQVTTVPGALTETAIQP